MINKKSDKRTLKYAGKSYKIEIKHIDSPPYGSLYINGSYRTTVWTSITHHALIQHIQDYKRSLKN